MDDYEREYLIRQHEARCKLFCDSNNATIEFSKITLRGAFLLNGMAAIACMYSGKIEVAHLLSLITPFSIGALLAAVAGGSTYLTQLVVTGTWRRYLYDTPVISAREALARDQEQRRGNSIAHAFRVVSIFLVVGAYVCFGFGAYYGYQALK